jgi:microcystin-dependent protein
MSEPFIAEIRMVGFTFAPDGWALCNGQILSIASNTALFSLLGTNFGGNGTSTFGLPKLQGQVPIGQGSGPGLNPIEVGESMGLNGITLNANELPSHTHTLVAAGNPPTTHSPSGTALATQLRSAAPIYTGTAPNVTMAPQAIAITGANTPYSNLQPYLVVNFVIALQGIFPARN